MQSRENTHVSDFRNGLHCGSRENDGGSSAPEGRLGILTRLGAKGSVTALVRGGVPGTLNLITEYEDAAAFGAALDRINTDPDIQSLLARGQAAQSLVPVRSADYMELPGLETPHADIASCTAMRATMFQIHNGKQAVSLERIKRSKEITEKHGAKVRALQSVDSDPFGVFAVVYYYPNLTEAGKIGMSLAADPVWQAYIAEILGEQASADFLRTTLMRVI